MLSARTAVEGVAFVDFAIGDISSLRQMIDSKKSEVCSLFLWIVLVSPLVHQIQALQRKASEEYERRCVSLRALEEGDSCSKPYDQRKSSTPYCGTEVSSRYVVEAARAYQHAVPM